MIVSAVLLLKRLPRTGWVHAKVREPESVADHSYALAVLAMLNADSKGLDTEKAMKIALLHDIVESHLGDLTPKVKRKISKPILEAVEKAVFNQIISSLPPKQAKHYAELYAEYLMRISPEARLVNHLDKKEMMYEAVWLSSRRLLDLNKLRGLKQGFIARKSSKK